MTSLETIFYNGHQFNLGDIVGTPKNKLGNNQLGIITHISNRLASNDSNAGFTNITLRMHDGSSKVFELNDLEYIEKIPISGGRRKSRHKLRKSRLKSRKSRRESRKSRPRR